MDAPEPDATTAEIVKQFGNMYLVEVDGALRRVPATYKNELLYEHELYELLTPTHADERVLLRDGDGDPDTDTIAVAPTADDSVYELWVGTATQPVVNPPDKAETLLCGVRNALQSPASYATLEQLYADLAANRVRKEVIARTEAAFPHSSVIPRERGWSILGVFLLTWDARIFLDTDASQDTAFRVAGSGVTETDQPREFLHLDIPGADDHTNQTLKLRVSPAQSVTADAQPQPVDTACPSCDGQQVTAHQHPAHETDVYACQSCAELWRELALSQREVAFLGKANWLLHHREQYDDDTFWDIIEQYVWYDRS